MTAHETVVAFLRGFHDRLCAGLEAADGGAKFREDSWERPGGGGGRSRVMTDGAVFEKAGVNFSEVHGEFSPEFARLAPIEPIKIINLIQKDRSYKLAGQDKISLLRHCPTLNDKVVAVKDMIRQLSN